MMRSPVDWVKVDMMCWDVEMRERQVWRKVLSVRVRVYLLYIHVCSRRMWTQTPTSTHMQYGVAHGQKNQR